MTRDELQQIAVRMYMLEQAREDAIDEKQCREIEDEIYDLALSLSIADVLAMDDIIMGLAAKERMG